MYKHVDPSTIKFPDEMHKMDKETYFFSKWVYKISTKRKKNKRLFIITDWEFIVLKKKAFHKKLILSYSFRWYDITSIEYDEEKEEEFTIRFKNDESKKKKKQTVQSIQNQYSKTRDYFTFKYPKSVKMLKMLYTYLNCFHMPEDLPKFNFPENLYTNAKGSIPDHMRMKLRLDNHRISTTTLDTLKNFVLSEPTEFSFTQIRGIISSLPIFLECIYLAPSINTLIIPFDVNFDSLKILIDFLPNNENITSLVFKDKLPDKFSDFKDAFLSTISTENIDSIKFINSKFTLQNVNDISKIIQKRTIKTLHLKNSLGPLTLKPFIQTIYDNPGFQSITNFTLDHTQSIDIRTLLPYLKHVTTLTLIHCEFEIADFFDILTVDYSMTSLNISQNNNDKQIFHSITFPQHLTSIVVRDIEWELLSLSNFIESVMNHRPISSKDEIGDNQIKLDLSQLKMSETYWSSFFENIEEKPRGSVVSLGWDENPIDKRFVRFINSFLNLSYLSLNGCFFKENEDFESLLKFIADSTSLSALSIHGTELQNLGKNVLAVIDTLYINRSLRRIDVSSHQCGNSILMKLADVMLQNRVVEEVSFSAKNNITDISLFETFFIVVGKNRGKPLFTEFPSSFAKSALQFGAISDHQYEKMRIDYEAMIKGNQKVTIPQMTVKRLKNKKFVFRNYLENPDLVDYDENARIRRNQILKKFKMSPKKDDQELPSSSNLVDIDQKVTDENGIVYEADDDLVDDSDELVKTKKVGKKRKSIKKASRKSKKMKSGTEKVDDGENLNADGEKLNESQGDAEMGDGLSQKDLDELEIESDAAVGVENDEVHEIQSGKISSVKGKAKKSSKIARNKKKAKLGALDDDGDENLSLHADSVGDGLIQKDSEENIKQEDTEKEGEKLNKPEEDADAASDAVVAVADDGENIEEHSDGLIQKDSEAIIKQEDTEKEGEELNKPEEDVDGENIEEEGDGLIQKDSEEEKNKTGKKSSKKKKKSKKRTNNDASEQQGEEEEAKNSIDMPSVDSSAKLAKSTSKSKKGSKQKHSVPSSEDFDSLGSVFSSKKSRQNQDDDEAGENQLIRSIDELNAELEILAQSNELTNEDDEDQPISATETNGPPLPPTENHESKPKKKEDLNDYSYEEENDEFSIPMPPKEADSLDGKEESIKQAENHSQSESNEELNESADGLQSEPPVPPDEAEIADSNPKEKEKSLNYSYEEENDEFSIPMSPKETDSLDGKEESNKQAENHSQSDAFENSQKSADGPPLPPTENHESKPEKKKHLRDYSYEEENDENSAPPVPQDEEEISDSNPKEKAKSLNYSYEEENDENSVPPVPQDEEEISDSNPKKKAKSLDHSYEEENDENSMPPEETESDIEREESSKHLENHTHFDEFNESSNQSQSAPPVPPDEEDIAGSKSGKKAQSSSYDYSDEPQTMLPSDMESFEFDQKNKEDDENEELHKDDDDDEPSNEFVF